MCDLHDGIYIYFSYLFVYLTKLKLVRYFRQAVDEKQKIS